MTSGRRWSVRDRSGNTIYLTEERWEHITDPINHPEMSGYEEHLKTVIRTGRRKQDPLNPQKYRYSHPFNDLVEDNTHIVAIVLCRFSEGDDGKPIPNNSIVRPIKRPFGDAMSEPVYQYDEASDTLAITFVPGEHATGIELTDHILLRLNLRERRAVGITLFDYSILTGQTELGARSFPLTGLDQLPGPTRDVVLEVLRQPPVRAILSLSAYTPSVSETTPIIAVQPLPMATNTA